MTTPDYLTVIPCYPVPVARLEGEIDLANAPTLAERLIEAIPDAAPGLIVDVTTTPYLDSAGVRALFRVARQLGLREQRLVVVITEHSPIWRLLKATRVEEAAQLCDTIDSAVEHLTGT